MKTTLVLAQTLTLMVMAVVGSKDTLDEEVKEYLNDEDIDTIRKTFELFDSDHSGTVSTKEILLAMHNTLFGPEEEDSFHDLLKELDTEMDGDSESVIAFDDFLKHMGQKAVTVGKSKKAMKLFYVFDQNNDGFITDNEFEYALKKLDQPMSAEDTAKMIDEADTDKDGKINLNEFATKVLNKEEEKEKKAKEKKGQGSKRTK